MEAVKQHGVGQGKETTRLAVGGNDGVNMYVYNPLNSA